MGYLGMDLQKRLDSGARTCQDRIFSWWFRDVWRWEAKASLGHVHGPGNGKATTTRNSPRHSESAMNTIMMSFCIFQSHICLKDGRSQRQPPLGLAEGDTQSLLSPLPYHGSSQASTIIGKTAVTLLWLMATTVHVDGQFKSRRCESDRRAVIPALVTNRAIRWPLSAKLIWEGFWLFVWTQWPHD